MPACRLWTVEFDFEARTEAECDLARARAAMAQGRFAWFDVEFDDPVAARADLEELGLLHPEIIDGALEHEATTKHARYPDHLHLVLSGARLEATGLALERVDVVVGERFLVTLHRGPALFLNAVKAGFRDDFRHHAQSPSFLVYELWDHLVHNYVEVQARLTDRVERLQAELMTQVDERVFAEVAKLGTDLLQFRKVLLPSRAVLTDLSTRKSRFVSDATQPFLANMVGSVESVLQDLLVDREVLQGALNLSVSMVSHRTNEVMRRLTLVSIVFLPLTFLVGVYGMNFDVLPELHWEYGYGYFWALVGGITLAQLFFMRRKKLL